MPTLLKKLGIPSPRHAAEIERDLGIRFSDFTPEHCDTWTEQTLYLYQFAQTRTTTHAARTAGITLAAARQWQSDNTLGFNQRLDDAVLEYTDDMEVLFLERTRQPDSPTSFMTTLLRAQMPEKYGPARRSTAPRDNHCDHDRGDDQDSEHTPAPSKQQPTVPRGHPTPTRTTPAPHGQSPPSHTDLSHTEGEDTAHPNLSPHGGETQRGGTPTPNDASDLSPTDQAPVGAGFKPALVPSPTTEETTHPDLSPTREKTPHIPISPPPGERHREGALPHPRDHTSRSLPHRPSTRRGRFQTCPCSLPNHGRDHTSRSLPRRGRDTERGHTPTPSTWHPAPGAFPNPSPTPRTPTQTQAQTPKIPPPPRPQLNHTHGPFTLSLSKGRA